MSTVSASRGKPCGLIRRARRFERDLRILGTMFHETRKRSASLFLRFACVDQPTWPKARHKFGQTRIGNGEASLASTEHAEVADHSVIHVPSTMHHDSPRQRVVIRRVQSLEPHRVAMSTDIDRTRSIGSGGGRVRVRLIGEALEPSRMRRVGTPSMCNQVRPHATVRKVHQVESRCTRRKGEVRDADKVAGTDAVTMLLQSIERTTKQTGVDVSVVTSCSSESKHCPRRSRCKDRERKVVKETAGKYQDIDLRHKHALMLT